MKNIYVVGDSISIAYGPFLEAGLAGKANYERKTGLAEALKNLDIPQGANAGDSRALRKYIEHRFKDGRFKPDILVVNCGLHDVKMHAHGIQIPLLEYRENISAVARLTQQHGVQMVWVRITAVDDEIHNVKYPTDFKRFNLDVKAYNEAADEIMTDLEIPIIDLNGFTSSISTDLYCDHVHFKPNICEQQGQFMADELLDYC